MLLAAHGGRVPDISLGGGLAKPSQIFNALALCSPYAKLVCMGRAMMIPGFVGANIEGALHPERRAEVCGNWDSLPRTVQEIGTSAETIFAGYHAVAAKVGKREMARIPYGIPTWEIVLSLVLLSAAFVGMVCVLTLWDPLFVSALPSGAVQNDSSSLDCLPKSSRAWPVPLPLA